MRIIPVIDLMNGVVVRGVAGRRELYRPLVSPLCPNSDPAELMRAYRDTFGLDEVYLADLDAILGGEPSFALYNAVLWAGAVRLLVDAGIGDVNRLGDVASFGAEVVVGLETLPGPDVLADMVLRMSERLVFSLDLRGGEPLGDPSGWKYPTAWGIATQAVELGVRCLLVLDLARVGVNEGTGTEGLSADFVAAFPEIEVLAGGGVRGRDDLVRLRDLGVSGVLVSSALHDGRLTRADLEGL
jgi:phosphoribosylformimino-5-aminoimidazole carboxamide ribotide isomerase